MPRAGETAADFFGSVMLTIVVASRNKGKIAEIARIFEIERIPVSLLSVADFNLPDIEETGDTFEANAILKARTVAQATGQFALADDSGIEVDALGGAPGVFSARWAGVHGDDRANIEKLLRDVLEVNQEDRGAAFISVVAFAKPDGSVITARGELHGTLCQMPRGSNGFGYDPIFVPESDRRTLAEMAPEEKDAISHRARALDLLAPKIGTFISGR